VCDGPNCPGPNAHDHVFELVRLCYNRLTIDRHRRLSLLQRAYGSNPQVSRILDFTEQVYSMLSNLTLQ